ncbi:unnamed protein product [Kluyveromyces dobzhanskii CBS 2104]|uniref:Peptide-N(4)-(N-acetyl-beta-glucosaminyl)asparagine amidase n=1 Tax=Kluyveromyces dobzhanskii CBS 2104 TaxID=1427455 RepID=A0A0A8LAC8_9SACH|nr:unnamed protein product [Kluyveromyces dobzhanskii CBS 2104]
MADIQETLSSISKKFLELYRSKVVSQWKGIHGSSDDDRRFNSLIQHNGFANQIFGLYKSLCFRYENDSWYSIVLDTLNLDLIYANIDKAIMNNNASDIEYQDYLVKELLRYFKNDFFSWCNKPKCVKCGNDDQMECIGTDRANSEEAKFQCGNVEVFRCNSTGDITRFPRYNDPVKLLQTRTGRCGEWCNVFTLILKSFGLDARYIWNKEDHVWCEFYSPNLRRWVHLDSCEQSFDEPHIYSNNWNKKMSYVFAFSNDIVVDVSSRYILKNNLPRTDISEADLNFLMVYLTRMLRKELTDDQLYTLDCRDEQERLEWQKTPTSNHKATTTLEGTQGRESGSTAWKQQRGEDGS